MKNKSIWNEMKPYLIISFGMLIYAFAIRLSVVELQVLLLYYSICSKFR